MGYPRIREIDPGMKSYDEAFETFRRAAPRFYILAEDTRDRHAEQPAVALSTVIASPDGLGRGDVVQAFVKPGEGFRPPDGPAREIRRFVKDTPARHEYPREIELLDGFPLTTTGEIRRNELRLRDLERGNAAE